jgi:hypothetical protein
MTTISKSNRCAAIGFCFILGCQPSTKTSAAPPPRARASTLFNDSSIYRANCKEADTLPQLTVIPRKCTPRDQRAEIR